MLFFVSLLVDGALAGAIYGLIALAFVVVVYKASRMINFALGEWVMLAAMLVATGLHAIGVGLPGALGLAGLGMVALGRSGSAELILRRLVGRPLIWFIMVTLGLGALMRGASAVVFRGISPRRSRCRSPSDALAVHGVLISTGKLAAALVAAVAIAAVSWFFRRSRAGLALQAIADDQQAAMGVGIDLDRHFALTWAIMGGLCAAWRHLVGVRLGRRAWYRAGGATKVFPIVVVGGLDSIPGTIVGAVALGVLESLAAGYLDPLVGGGFSNVASYLVLVAMLFARPYGVLFGRPDVARV